MKATSSLILCNSVVKHIHLRGGSQSLWLLQPGIQATQYTQSASVLFILIECWLSHFLSFIYCYWTYYYLDLITVTGRWQLMFLFSLIFNLTWMFFKICRCQKKKKYNQNYHFFNLTCTCMVLFPPTEEILLCH